MLRETLLFMSESQGVRSILTSLPGADHMAAKFVAGETPEEALATAKALNDDGFRVTLDLLGESVSVREEAETAARAYRASLDRIEASEAVSTISLKLTQLGLDIDHEFCFENILGIVQHAETLGNFVRIDMESSEHTERTLEIFHRVFERHSNVGIVIQSYLRRSEADIRELVRVGAPVRLCKGAYQEPASVAFQQKSEVDASFVRLMRLLLDGGAQTAIASHDERMIDATLSHVAREGIPEDAFELQMLYGVRREYQRRLVSNGLNMRIYLPYGSEWYSYFMRRMAERPANLLFGLRAALGG
ncbi:MAG: proline dehydrogenase family protein [marine benthic group bacterium]|nr:proline dehydrogenase family protein [Gemmatimonadota bacterium]